MEAVTKWLEELVRGWCVSLKGMGFEFPEVERAQRYIDMEYPEIFEYPRHYLAFRAFFLGADLAPGAESDNHHLASRPSRTVTAIEAAYRMGWDDAMQKVQEEALAKCAPGEQTADEQKTGDA